MKVSMIAIDSFAHANKMYAAGDKVEVSKGEADELLSAGLVRDGEGAAEGPSQKMDEAPENKMDSEVENKSAARKTTTPKAK